MTDPLLAIGYWYSDAEPWLPHPQRLIDESDFDERDFVIEYLRRGQRVAVSLGASPCRICGVANGSSEFSDGMFVWPEGLVHYLVEHQVRLPSAVADKMWQRLGGLELTPRDTSWWNRVAGEPCPDEPVSSPSDAHQVHQRWVGQRNRKSEDPEYPQAWVWEQCGGCRHWLPLAGTVGADWGVCSNAASPFDRRAMFEHDGCENYTEDPSGWRTPSSVE